jgi:hypothetical protein
MDCESSGDSCIERWVKSMGDWCMPGEQGRLFWESDDQGGTCHAAKGDWGLRKVWQIVGIPSKESSEVPKHFLLAASLSCTLLH